MKIMYLTDQVFLHGGVEKVLSQKANWFADAAGDEVWIVTTRQQGRKPVYGFSSKIKWRDLGVDYQIKDSYFSKVNLKKIPSHYRKLKKVINEIKPDVIVSCNFAPDFYFLPSLSRQIPKIKEFHGSRALRTEPEGLINRILSSLDFRTEAKYDALAVLNPDELKYYHGGNPVVIPNPVESSALQADISAKKILAAGRLSPVKNFEALINIWATIAKFFPDWEVHIYGEDYLGTAEKLSDQIKKNDLQTSVKLMGVSGDMKKTMQEYSIYAMTSESECFPMVLLEALSVGMPIISWNCPTGPANIVTDSGDGFIVPDKDAETFASRFRLLMENADLRKKFGETGKINVQRFETDPVMNQWKSMFTNLIKKKK